MQDSLPIACQALSDGIGYPQDNDKRFHSVSRSPPFLGLYRDAMLGAVQIVLSNHLHAERPEGEAWACNLYYIISLYNY